MIEQGKGTAVAEPTTHDIVDTAVENGKFTTLAAALTAAGLIATLKGTGPFTVFAPTDTAFAALPKGAVEGLLADVPKLKGVLTYHVVSGKMSAADLKAKSDRSGHLVLKTVNGQDLSINVSAAGVRVGPNDKIGVVMADVAASNGVIHVIDGVLMPKA
jgi:uncharacterized surface protein with fasciclin (FAS1) repeats